MKINIDKIQKAKKNSALKFWIGGFFILSSGSVLIDYINENKGIGEIVIGTIMFLSLITVTINGIKQGLLVRKTKNYSAIIENYKSYGEVNTNELAELTKSSEENVVKNIQEMIKRQYIYGAYIDFNNKKIVFSNKDLEKTKNINNEFEVVTCPNCGGNNNVLKGSTVECEYCGSVIKN
ncbi:PCI domain-containing protein [Miniphocaeibacter massiliensis]|uniref:PCI domain-containing protein n=1 Tax=Miniphocaeibacter massiliensis TaxID=2041841 RepID=UPI000C1C49A3|nr:hypothetical protein [Miniphocaeibacter massiliensis]